MTSGITPPKAQIPIGIVTIDGHRFEVAQHPEFVRFFFDLMRRAGGASALTNTDLALAIQSTQAGEVVMQSAGASSAMVAEMFQPAHFPATLADVMQSGGGDALGELTWQK